VLFLFLVFMRPFSDILGKGSSKNISRGGWYVILHSKIGWRKSKVGRFGSGKWFWLHISSLFAVAGEMSVMNMI
jgi:hypothetical protein